MTVPTNIPETPMAHTHNESLQQYKEDSSTSKSMDVYQHVLKTVMDIQNEDEIQSFSKWMNTEGMTTLLTFVLISTRSRTISMTTVTTEWMDKSAP